MVDSYCQAFPLPPYAEVEEGGETAIPLAVAIDPAVQKIDHLSPCASRMGLSVKPKKGDALLFFDLDLAATKGERLPGV